MYSNIREQSSPFGGIKLSYLTPSDQAKFEQLFTQSAAQYGGNNIPANVVGDILRRSNLDNESLAKIWDLSSISNNPYLTFPEFAVAMYLTSSKLSGKPLPSTLPPNVKEETDLALAIIASLEPPKPLIDTTPSMNQPQQQFMAPQVNAMTGMMPQMSMMTGMNQVGLRPQQAPVNQYMTGYTNNYQMPMQTGFNPTPPAKTRLQNTDFAQKMMPNQSRVTNLLTPSLGTTDANKISWTISPQDKQRYRDIFNAWEGSGSGFMSADTAKDVFTQSQLPPQTLMKIWNLADRENKGSLDMDEFAIAMHLIYRKLNGFEVPVVLPPELAPPSSVLKKFVLGRRPPPSTPKFTAPPAREEEPVEEYDNGKNDYVSSSRRKGQSYSGRGYSSRSYEEEDDVDIELLEDLRREISETKRQLDRIPVPRNRDNKSSNKYSMEELKEKIRKTNDQIIQISRSNPTSKLYFENIDTLMELLETQKSLQDEIQYLCNRDIPVLARQLRGSAAELRDTKVRQSRKHDGTQDFMAFVVPTGPGGSITESDRVRAKAKAMMAARKAGNTGASSDAQFSLRRAEEEKEEADRKANDAELDMERYRTTLMDMRSDLKYLEDLNTSRDIEIMRLFQNSQNMSYEVRHFVEQLNSQGSSTSNYGTYQSQKNTRDMNDIGSSSSGYQISLSPTSNASLNTSSPKPKATVTRPRTADEIKKEAERRVQERLAALQLKRNPNATAKPTQIRKPDEAEAAAQRRLRDEELEAQEMLRRSVAQREENDRRNREIDFQRTARQRLEDEERARNLMDQQRDQAQQEEQRPRREEEERKQFLQEEEDFEERRRQILVKEEAARKARFDALLTEEDKEEEQKAADIKQLKQHKPEEAFFSESSEASTISFPAHVSSSAAAPISALPPAETSHEGFKGNNNPFAKLQNNMGSAAGSSQAEKPNEVTNKRVSYNPFATFSAFSASKADSEDGSESDDDGWDIHRDDSEDEKEFPAAGSAKNLASMLFNVINKRQGGNGTLETVREATSKSNDENESFYSPSSDTNFDSPSGISSSIPPPPPAPPAPNNYSSIPAPPPPPAPPGTPLPPSTSSLSTGGGVRGALLSQIETGTRLRKVKTNDRSASSVSGRVL
ncbi:hypothetical protein BDB01DRAFT_755855 [Pilobolus umbonatus]|nr:hypothetical protein BDB01DRAFT_755855 [Pilobolus umbonatus]